MAQQQFLSPKLIVTMTWGRGNGDIFNKGKISVFLEWKGQNTKVMAQRRLQDLHKQLPHQELGYQCNVTIRSQVLRWVRVGPNRCQMKSKTYVLAFVLSLSKISQNVGTQVTRLCIQNIFKLQSESCSMCNCPHQYRTLPVVDWLSRESKTVKDFPKMLKICVSANDL